jgi:hypothetical protein
VKLRNRKFEKSLRRRVRVELRKSREKWREYRRGRRRWRDYQIGPWVARIVFTFLFLPLVARNLWGLQGVLGGAVVFCLLATSWRAGQWLVALRAAPSLMTYIHLPLSGPQVFTLLWRRFLLTSLWSWWDFAVIYSLVAEQAGFGVNCVLAGVGMGLVQWFGMLAMATCLVAYFPKRKIFPTAWILVPLVIGLVLFGPSLYKIADWIGRLGYWIPGTGWILYALGLSRPAGFLGNLWPAFSMAAVLFLFPLAWRHLRRTSVLPEVISAGATERAMVEAARRRQSDGTETDPYADIKAAIRTRQFLQGMNWRSAGWLERIVSMSFTPSQRLAAEFLTAGKPGWGKWMVRLALFWCGLAVVMYVFPRGLSAFPIGLISLGVFYMNASSKSWPGTGLRRVGGMDSAVSSVYPLGFGQMAGVILKVNAVRLLVSAPFLAAVGMLLAYENGYDLAEGGVLILKILLVFAAAMPFLTLLFISPGTDDTKRTLTVLMFVAGVMVVLASAVTFIFAPMPISLAAAVVMFAGSFGILKGYNHAYDNNWFDLQRRPDQGKQVPGQ